MLKFIIISALTLIFCPVTFGAKLECLDIVKLTLHNPQKIEGWFSWKYAEKMQKRHLENLKEIGADTITDLYPPTTNKDLSFAVLSPESFSIEKSGSSQGYDTNKRNRTLISIALLKLAQRYVVEKMLTPQQAFDYVIKPHENYANNSFHVIMTENHRYYSSSEFESLPEVAPPKTHFLETDIKGHAQIVLKTFQGRRIALPYETFTESKVKIEALMKEKGYENYAEISRVFLDKGTRIDKSDAFYIQILQTAIAAQRAASSNLGFIVACHTKMHEDLWSSFGFKLLTEEVTAKHGRVSYLHARAEDLIAGLNQKTKKLFEAFIKKYSSPDTNRASQKLASLAEKNAELLSIIMGSDKLFEVYVASDPRTKKLKLKARIKYFNNIERTINSEALEISYEVLPSDSSDNFRYIVLNFKATFPDGAIRVFEAKAHIPVLSGTMRFARQASYEYSNSGSSMLASDSYSFKTQQFPPSVNFRQIGQTWLEIIKYPLNDLIYFHQSFSRDTLSGGTVHEGSYYRVNNQKRKNEIDSYNYTLNQDFFYEETPYTLPNLIDRNIHNPSHLSRQVANPIWITDAIEQLIVNQISWKDLFEALELNPTK